MTDFLEKDSVPHSGLMAIKAKGGKWAQHAVRLRVLRCALFKGIKPSAFARELGVSPQRLGNMENGYPLSTDVAFKIKAAAPGLTLDWLYHGEERGMPFEMVTSLREEASRPEHAQPPEDHPPRKRSKSRSPKSE